MNGPIAIAIIFGFFVLFVSSGAVWALRRPRRAPDADQPGATLQADRDGVVVVPVTGTFTTGGFGAFTKNSLSGALAIAPDGIRFKVLATGAWSFSEIEKVDVRKTVFGARLVFVSRVGGRTLGADVRNLDVARQVVRALPPDVVLTAKAAAVRRGDESAS